MIGDMKMPKYTALEYTKRKTIEEQEEDIKWIVAIYETELQKKGDE